MRLMTTNYATESATEVTASSENPRFPASNLKHPFRSRRWRSIGSTDQSVVFDLQTTEEIDSVVLLWPKEDGIRLSGSAVIRVQANATNVWTSPAVNEVLTIDNNYVLASKFFAVDQTYRFWRVSVTDPGNPFGCVELGVVWLGKGLAIPSAQNGFKSVISDQSKESKTDFGHSYVDEYPLSSSIQIQYSNIDYSDVQTLENAFRTNGIRKPVMLAIDPLSGVFDANHFLFYGKFSPSFGLSHVVFDALNVDGISIEELA